MHIYELGPSAQQEPAQHDEDDETQMDDDNRVGEQAVDHDLTKVAARVLRNMRFPPQGNGMPRSTRIRTIFATAAVILASACVVSESDEKAADTGSLAQPAPGSNVGTVPAAPIDSAAMAPAATVSDMRLEVDLKARKLNVFKGGTQVATHSVAVGSERWPTQT